MPPLTNFGLIILFLQIFFFHLPVAIFKYFYEIPQSALGVGVHYGFLTTFSPGPSYFFLILTRNMEEGEDEKDIASSTGFVVGQLIMFVSVYYLPLHQALRQGPFIVILVVLYLFCHFFSYKDGLTSNKSMRNLSTQCLCLKNLVFPLFNIFIFPNETLARLVHTYMSECYNENMVLFLIGSFVAWFIGQNLFIILKKIFRKALPIKKLFFLFLLAIISFFFIFFLPFAALQRLDYQNYPTVKLSTDVPKETIFLTNLIIIQPQSNQRQLKK